MAILRRKKVAKEPTQGAPAPAPPADSPPPQTPSAAQSASAPPPEVPAPAVEPPQNPPPPVAQTPAETQQSAPAAPTRPQIVANPAIITEGTPASNATNLLGDLAIPARQPRTLLTKTQIVLIGAFCLTGIVLVFSLSKQKSKPRAEPSADLPGGQALIDLPEFSQPGDTGPTYADAQPPAAAAQTPQKRPVQPVAITEQIYDAVAAEFEGRPLSLKIAEDLFAQKDYRSAYTAFNLLRQNLLSDGDGPLRDFLLLRMAICSEKQSDFDRAGQILRVAADSRWPLVRTIANYRLAAIGFTRGQWLNARIRAYRAMALVGCLAFDWQWSASLERNCQLLAAQSLTRSVLSLGGTNEEIPPELWAVGELPDPFVGLNETELRAILADGSDHLSKGVLAPQVTRTDSSATARWSIVCNGPSIEELLSNLALQAGMDVRWFDQPTEEKVDIANLEGSRRRAVSMYMPAAATQQAAAVAAGSVGLMADFDPAGAIRISDPARYTVLSDHASLLTDQSIALWQQFLLAYVNDEHSANAHFALGLLKARKGKTLEAITEFKLVAGRYSQTTLAPSALFHCGRLKAAIRDFVGAREDLRELIDVYPDNELAGQANLYLAETTHQAGLYAEAVKSYRKVYNLGLSEQMQITAALGAGKCYFELKDYEQAAKWLGQYIESAAKRGGKGEAMPDGQPAANAELYNAWYMLGEAQLAQGNLAAARDAFRRTLAGPVSRDRYIDAVAALADTQIQQQDFVAALNTLEEIRTRAVSQEQSTRLLVLKSRILREMGLMSEAVTILNDRAKYLTDPALKAAVAFELAKCRVTSGEWELAFKDLSEILTFAEPGKLSQEVAVELAAVCLHLGKNEQTITLCTKLLESAESQQVRQRSAKLLAAAHSNKKNYNQAALALLGRWNETGPGDTK